MKIQLRDREYFYGVEPCRPAVEAVKSVADRYKGGVMERIFQFGIRDGNSYRVVNLKESHLEPTGGMIRIGSDDRCELQLQRGARCHSMIRVEGTDLVFVDLGNVPSALLSSHRLRVGDRIEIGGTTIAIEGNYLQPDA